MVTVSRNSKECWITEVLDYRGPVWAIPHVHYLLLKDAAKGSPGPLHSNHESPESPLELLCHSLPLSTESPHLL